MTVTFQAQVSTGTSRGSSAARRRGRAGAPWQQLQQVLLARALEWTVTAAEQCRDASCECPSGAKYALLQMSPEDVCKNKKLRDFLRVGLGGLGCITSRAEGWSCAPPADCRAAAACWVAHLQQRAPACGCQHACGAPPAQILEADVREREPQVVQQIEVEQQERHAATRAEKAKRAAPEVRCHWGGGSAEGAAGGKRRPAGLHAMPCHAMPGAAALLHCSTPSSGVHSVLQAEADLSQLGPPTEPENRKRVRIEKMAERLPEVLASVRQQQEQQQQADAEAAAAAAAAQQRAARRRVPASRRG